MVIVMNLLNSEQGGVKMNKKEFSKRVQNCCIPTLLAMEDLNKAVNAAGGSGFSFRQLTEMSALDLLMLIAPNNISFVCTVQRKEVKENKIIPTIDPKCPHKYKFGIDYHDYKACIKCKLRTECEEKKYQEDEDEMYGIGG
jgi:hypothetical protein